MSVADNDITVIGRMRMACYHIRHSKTYHNCISTSIYTTVNR